MHKWGVIGVACFFAVMFFLGETGIFHKKNDNASGVEKIEPVAPPILNSSWDGSVRQVEAFLKKNLKDPDSYQSIEWGKAIESGDYYLVRHKYRAKNSYGGYAIEEYAFALDKTGNVVDAVDYADEKAKAIFFLTYQAKESQKKRTPEFSVPGVNLILKDAKINTLDIVKDLPIHGKTSDKNDAGKKRLRWKVDGDKNDLGLFESVGEDQRDADKVGGSCPESGPDGNFIWPRPVNSVCWKLVAKLMSHVVNEPEVFLDAMEKRAAQVKGTASVQYGDIWIEISKDGYFYIRRMSR